MPFTMPQFPLLNKEQASPFNDLFKNAMEGYQGGVQMQYAKPMASQELQKAILANQLSQQEQQWNPKKWQSEIDLRGAETQQKKAETRLLPTKYNIEMMNARARQNQNITTAANNFRQWAATPEGQQIISNRPDMAQAVLTNMTRMASIGNNEPINQSSFSQGSQSSLGQSNQSSGSQINQSNAKPDPYQTQPTNPQVVTENPPINHNESDAQLIKNIQNAAGDAYAKTEWPADIRKRLYAGERFKVTAPEVIKNFDMASNYFSLGGQAQLKADEARALKGYVSPQLQAYRNFKRGVEQLSVQGAFLEGVPADQISRGQYNSIYDIEHFLNNPKGAKETFMQAIQFALLADDANKQRPGDLLKSGEKEKYLKNAVANNPSVSGVNNTTTKPTKDEVDAEMKKRKLK